MPSQLLSWSLLCCCFCAHHAVHALSSPPLDLLAYPAYSVQLRPDLPISNTSAQRILSGNKEVTEEVEESQRTGLLLRRDDDEAQAGPSNAQSTKPYLLRSAGNGQGYLCSVPQQSQATEGRLRRDAQTSQRPRLTAEEKSEKRRKNEEEKRQAYERGLALLEPLKGSCLYLTQGWFTYGFCHGSEIRQFHAIRTASPGGHGLSEDLSQESYTLGQFTNRVVEDEGLVDTKRARALGSLREILESDDKVDGQALEVGSRGRAMEDDDVSVDDDKRYLVQLWTGGTLCDKTGAERKTEVQFHCNSQTTDRIFLIRETAICEYVIVIHTPRLCGEPIFVGSGASADEAARAKKKKAVSVIECRPVLRDDAPLLHAAPLQAAPGLLLEQPVPLPVNMANTPESSEEKSVPPAVQQGDTSSEAHSHDTPAPQQLEIQDANSVVQELLAERAAQDTPTSSESKPTDNDKDVMLDYVLVVDPATGEVSVESESDGKAGDGASTLEPIQEIIKLLRQSLEDALNVVHPEDRPEDAPVEPGQAQETQHPIQRQTNVNKKLQDSLSRFHKAGARNHKAMAEQFLKGQLKEPKRKGQNPPQLSKADEVQPQRQTGTPQHRNLKKAFDTKWDDEQTEQANEGTTRARDEL